MDNHQSSTFTGIVNADIGCWVIRADHDSVLSVSHSGTTVTGAFESNDVTELAAQQLREYFSKQRESFDIPLDMSGASDFYRQVWQALQQIPYGRTTSYSALSNTIGNPKAVRAVGMANGKNPFAIVVPCHRVIGRDNSLTGYAAGIKVKRWLLEHEGVLAHQPSLF